MKYTIEGKTIEIFTKQITELKPYDKNSRTHPKQQIELLKRNIKEFGYTAPIIIDKEFNIIAGHGRLEALKELKVNEVPCVFIDYLNEKQVKALRLADNKLQEMSEWNMDLVIPELKELDDDLLELTGFDKDLIIEEDEKDDEIPETPKEPQTKLGDIYILGGKHRVMCADSTKIEDIEKLMDGKKADVGFNDPPYGMKKEKQGVMNDNLNYNDLLDFNRQWIPLQFGYLKDNGSFYCWGIDEPLMDIYSEIIKPYIKTQKATFRNLITWNKSYLKNGNTFNPFGASGSDGLRSYPTADEKCLFVMLGVQGFNNNADNYFEGWEPIRKYLNDEMDKCGGRSKWKEALGNQMGSHYFTKSQWTLPTEENYKKLQEYANGDAFKKEYDAFKKEYDELKKEYDELKKEYYSTRAYFDNADESNNIWNIEITRGDDKVKAEGHATPKPLELCERAIKSSCPENGLTIDFFLGSGSTLIACEKTNRICYGAELDPRYVDVIVQRYCDYVGDYKIIKNNQEIQWQK